jgi:catechol 2,3-dioxygenase-like lactoylglutathione lyase family enzyme
MEHAARVTSAVIFVSELGRSLDFYVDVFACEVAVLESEAALLTSSGGFQIYLIQRTKRTPHPSGGIGVQHLIWSVASGEELGDLERALTARGRHTDTYTSGGVQFLAGRDPDGIRILVAHPGPESLARSIVGARFYG